MKQTTKDRVRNAVYTLLFAGGLAAIGFLLHGMMDDVNAKHRIPGS